MILPSRDMIDRVIEEGDCVFEEGAFPWMNISGSSVTGLLYPGTVTQSRTGDNFVMVPEGALYQRKNRLPYPGEKMNRLR